MNLLINTNTAIISIKTILVIQIENVLIRNTERIIFIQNLSIEKHIYIILIIILIYINKLSSNFNQSDLSRDNDYT